MVDSSNNIQEEEIESLIGKSSLKMFQGKKVRPLSDDDFTATSGSVMSTADSPRLRTKGISASRDDEDTDSLSTIGLEESSYLKLKPFSRMDPTLVRLMTFLGCFGLTFDCGDPGRRSKGKRLINTYMKTTLMILIVLLSGEVVYDVNIRQSKLLAEQKRSTPLLTFVIVAYSWLTLVIPFICDVSLMLIGSYLFRFYSRTTATVCNGMFFGKITSVDSWYYYSLTVAIAMLDAVGQVVVLGVWPKIVDPYVEMVLSQDVNSALVRESQGNLSTASGTTSESKLTVAIRGSSGGARVNAYLLDSMLGETYAHSDLGIMIKIICLMIQFIHSHAFLMIIISFANHYATAIRNINENLGSYEFRKLLKQLIILRDSSEQISLMISIPFASIIMLVFVRQIALNGVFIQSTMLPFENWAVALQSTTCSISIFMVFIYCDGLQSASKQTHRLKTEHAVINENRGGNQSIYEFLDYLNRLSKSIRITFFNIIAINKRSLVGLYGHIITLTFVTS